MKQLEEKILCLCSLPSQILPYQTPAPSSNHSPAPFSNKPERNASLPQLAALKLQQQLG
jgi:hypothetical protein